MVYHTILSLEHIMPWTLCSNGTQHLMVCSMYILYSIPPSPSSQTFWNLQSVRSLRPLSFILIGDELLGFVLFWSVLIPESHTFRHWHIRSVCSSLYNPIVFFSLSIFLRLGGIENKPSVILFIKIQHCFAIFQLAIHEKNTS